MSAAVSGDGCGARGPGSLAAGVGSAAVSPSDAGVHRDERSALNAGGAGEQILAACPSATKESASPAPKLTTGSRKKTWWLPHPPFSRAVR